MHQIEFGSYYDITPAISNKLAVFPGDTPFSQQVALDFKKGHHLELSSMHTTLHIGAHADAPSHYHPDGVSIEARSLAYYLGPCQVISVQLPRGKRILPTHLASLKIAAPRLLFKTGSFPNPEQWNDDFNAFSVELIEWLAEKKVQLVGIDTPSVDLSQDKELEAHRAIFQADMAILEGIVLTEVPDGFYTLIALPLKIQGAEASPVRAILLKDIKG